MLQYAARLRLWQCWEMQTCGQSRFLGSLSRCENNALTASHVLLTNDVQFLFKHAPGASLENSLICKFALLLLLPRILFSSVISVVLVNGYQPALGREH